MYLWSITACEEVNYEHKPIIKSKTLVKESNDCDFFPFELGLFLEKQCG